MQNKKIYIDCFLNIIDNLGDIGFLIEFITFFEKNFGEKYIFKIFCNDNETLKKIISLNNLDKIVSIETVDDWHNTSKIAISFFHCPFPKGKYELALRFDYLSMDDIWLKNNLGEHIFSTKEHPIIEMIPSPKNSGSGLLPEFAITKNKKFFTEKFGFWNPEKKWISLFCYADTLEKFDFENINENTEIFILGHKNFDTKNRKNIFVVPFLDLENFYNFLGNSDYIITRGEISFMQVLQMGKPFLWDIYHDIWGFPTAQSEDFLKFLNAPDSYKNFSKKIWHSDEKLQFSEIISILESEKNIFKKRKYKNFAKEVKKILDKFEKSI